MYIFFFTAFDKEPPRRTAPAFGLARYRRPKRTGALIILSTSLCRQKALSERPVSPSFSAGPGARNLGILYGEKEHPRKTDGQHLSRKEVYMRTYQRSLSVKHWDLRNPSQKGVRTVCSALAEVTSRCLHIHGSFSYRDIQTNKYSICVSVMFTFHTVCVEFQ